MAEWSMAAVLKTAVPERVPGVRIPLSPPAFAQRHLSFALSFGWASQFKTRVAGRRAVARSPKAGLSSDGCPKTLV